MNRIALLTIFCVVFACLTTVGWAIEPGEVGVNYNCAFPNTVKVDGNLKDLPWADNIGGDIQKPKLGGCVGITQGPTTGTIAAVVTTNDD